MKREAEAAIGAGDGADLQPHDSYRGALQRIARRGHRHLALHRSRALCLQARHTAKGGQASCRHTPNCDALY